MTSSALNNLVPFSILHLSVSHFSLPHVFRCVTFVYNLEPNRDKLIHRFIRCTFFGYPRAKKGHRCYSPQSHKYHVSAEVTLFELTPFFSSGDHTFYSHWISYLPTIQWFLNPFLYSLLIYRFTKDLRTNILFFMIQSCHIIFPIWGSDSIYHSFIWSSYCS